MFSRTKKGYYFPTNPQKYRGDVNKIVYRSSWEHLAMLWLDTNPSVIAWGSEETVVPYLSVVDGRMHRYYVDFWCQVRQNTGKIIEALLEVKPDKQTRPPRKSKNGLKYMADMETWLKNDAKWKAARAYCQANGMLFFIVTEKTLKIAKHK